MNLKYIVTTKPDRLPKDAQILCVDGKPVGWEPSEEDECWDHHRPNGADIQIDEMPEPSNEADGHPCHTVLKMFGVPGKDQAIITTQIDADAIVAACWLQLSAKELNQCWHFNDEGAYCRVYKIAGYEEARTRDLLRAIAYDCDHLQVPAELSHLQPFAANVVAGLKLEGRKIADRMGELLGVDAFEVGDKVRFGIPSWDAEVTDKGETLLQLKDYEGVYKDRPAKKVGYPSDRSLWSEHQRNCYNDLSFKLRVEMMLDAIRGQRSFPGTLSGETDQYWEGVERDAGLLLSESSPWFDRPETKRVGYCYKSCLICDETELKRYVDPRALQKAVEQLPLYKSHGWSQYLPFTLTIKNKDNFPGGYYYILGSIAAHPQWKNLDFHRDGVYEALTRAERDRKDVFSLFLNERIERNDIPVWFVEEFKREGVVMIEGWGGRRSVGGSGWNTPSLLNPDEVIDIVLRHSKHE